MRPTLQKIVPAVLLVSSLSISGCQLQEEVRIGAPSAKGIIPENEIGIIKRISDKVAKEFDLVPASTAEIDAHDLRMRRLGLTGETVAMYDFPGSEHKLAMRVEKYHESKYQGLITVVAVSDRSSDQLLQRMTDELNAQLGPGRAELVHYSYARF